MQRDFQKENFNTTLKMKFIFTLESITPSDMLREISWQHFMPDFEHSWNANLLSRWLGQVKCVLCWTWSWAPFFLVDRIHNRRSNWNKLQLRVNELSSCYSVFLLHLRHLIGKICLFIQQNVNLNSAFSWQGASLNSICWNEIVITHEYWQSFLFWILRGGKLEHCMRRKKVHLTFRLHFNWYFRVHFSCENENWWILWAF